MTTVMVDLNYINKYYNTLTITVPPRWNVNRISVVLRLLNFQVCSSTFIEGACSHTTSAMGEMCASRILCPISAGSLAMFLASKNTFCQQAVCKSHTSSNLMNINPYVSRLVFKF